MNYLSNYIRHFRNFVFVGFLCVHQLASAEQKYPDLIISGKIIRIFGRCSIADCHTMKYLIETTHVDRKSRNVTDADIAVISACGDYSLKLGENYRFELTEKNFSLNINDENSESDPNETYNKLMNFCQFSILSSK